MHTLLINTYFVLRKYLQLLSSVFQLWYETDKKEFVVGQMLCLEASENLPRAMKCHEMGGNQEWKHNGGRDNGPIYNMAVGMCLGVSDSVQEGVIVEMVMCTSTFKNQWDILRI